MGFYAKKFWFRCELKRGSYIYGIQSTVASLFAIIFLILFKVYMEKIDLNDKRYFGILLFVSKYFWYIIIWTILMLISSVLLAVGAKKKNGLMMLPWIIAYGIVLILSAIVALVGLLIVIPLYAPYYNWWCVYSTYKEIKEEKESD